MDTSLSIFRMCSCLHDYRSGPFVSVRFQMNYLFLLFHTISFTRSKAISELSVTKLLNTLFKIDLAIFFASDVVFLG